MKLADFSSIWCVDTEFVSKTGERPSPVCLCAVEARTGELRTVWLAGGAPPAPPIPLGADVLYVCYSGRAELGVHLALGWPLPVNLLDLYPEHLRLANGRGWGLSKLTSLCRQLGVPSPAEEHKEIMRRRILEGPPFNETDRTSILNYCADDARMLVEPLKRLFDNEDIGLAVGARGEFIQVAASMEHLGLPIDTEVYEPLRKHMPDVWRHCVADLDQHGLYEDGHFRHSRLDQLVQTHSLFWPRTERGNLRTDEATWEMMTELHPSLVGPYAELKHIASWLREGLDLRVGSDGRSRPATHPFFQKTSRTSPSGSYIFAQPKWLRPLLKPAPCSILQYADYSQQEPALAGFLSGDLGLRRCYHTASGSFYVALMVECGAAPKEATKRTHPHVHKAGKVLLLAISYGAGAGFVAARLGISKVEAEDILRRLNKTFPVFFNWLQDVLLKARWLGYIETPDGWSQAADSQTNPRALYNFPMQACGAAMTRCAAILASKAGLRVLGTVHDALICELDSDDEGGPARFSAAMNAGAELLAPGYGIRHEVETVTYPNRYPLSDEPAARTFWNKVTRLVAREERRDPTSWLLPE